MVSDDPWFRPVDIELGPDGALYVADFYNRIIGHYEVPLDHPGRDRERGRIWRIVYKGKDGKARPPRKSPRPMRRWRPSPSRSKTSATPTWRSGPWRRRIRSSAEGPRLAEAVGALNRWPWRRSTGFQKAHGLWALHRLGVLDVDTLERATRDPDEAVRVHAMRILGDSPTPVFNLFAERHARTRDLARHGQFDPSPRVRRAMAEAFGRHPSRVHLHALLIETFKADPADSHLKHAVKMALRDQLLTSEAWDYVMGRKWADVEESYLAEASMGVPMAESARFLQQYLDHEAAAPPGDDQATRAVPPLSVEKQARYARHVARHGGPEAEAGLVKFARNDKFPATARVVLLKAIQQGTQERGGTLGPDARGLAVDVARALLASDRGEEIQAGIELAGSMKLEGVKDVLASVVEGRDGPTPRRVSAMAALAALDPAGSMGTLCRIVRDSGEPVEVRESAGNLLVASGKPEARATLVDALATAPARLQTAIATGLAQNREGAEALLVAVGQGKASARPLQERGVAVRLEASGVPEIKARLELLLKDLAPGRQAGSGPDREARRGGFLAFAKADKARGATVFAKNCASCHQLEGQGARVGPQLDGVGLRGLDRVLEDTLDPNRNVDQAFRVTTLSLERRPDPLRPAAQARRRGPRPRRRPGQGCPRPGLDRRGPQALAALAHARQHGRADRRGLTSSTSIAYLLSQRPK